MTGGAFPFSTVKYAGTTPGTDVLTYVLFASTLPTLSGSVITGQSTDAMNANRANAWPESSPALMGFRKVALTMDHSHGGTLNLYASDNRGVDWRQMDTIVVAAP